MTLTELRYIIAVAKEKHFGKAAKTCFASQPTLSVAVKKLEDELGVVIFERSKADVKITPVGERIIEQAERILSACVTLKEIAQSAVEQLTEPLRLGVIYTVGPYLLPYLVPNVIKIAPQLPLIVEEDYTANLRKKLIHGQLDAIVISLPFSDSSFIIKTLYDEPFVILLPANHHLTHKSTLSSKDLASENILLLGEGHCLRDQIIQICPECVNIHEDEAITTRHVEGSSLETIRHMVAANIGITVLPKLAAGIENYTKGLLTTREFKTPSPKRILALAYRKEYPRTKAIDVLIKAIKICDTN